MQLWHWIRLTTCPLLFGLRVTLLWTRKPPNIASRNISLEREATFLEKIVCIDWSLAYEACANHGVNRAYDLFLTKYKQTYEDSFPVIITPYRGKSSHRRTRLTQGLLKWCKKKNAVYQIPKFIKYPNERPNVMVPSLNYVVIFSKFTKVLSLILFYFLFRSILTYECLLTYVGLHVRHKLTICWRFHCILLT